jgi:ring-1,2-phenylacetyl-CoA epoxidase subunit PaaD
MVTPADERLRQRAWDAAATVVDPEIPVLSIADLGVLRDVTVTEHGVEVAITPTYSGCPAMQQIRLDLDRRLRHAGYRSVTVRTELSPPWTSDWITAQGRQKLAAAGIAPPGPAPGRPAGGPVPLRLTASPRSVPCPHCGAPQTRETSAFGATACRALYVCEQCREPFEHVKEI